MGEEQYLGILTTKFDNHISLGCEFSGSDTGSIDLLDKGKAAAVGHAHARRATNHEFRALTM